MSAIIGQHGSNIQGFTLEEFEARVEGYVAGFQEKINQNYALNYPNLTPDVLVVKKGRRYYKVVDGRSVRAFLDKTNGDILKPANYNAPAMHARGNLFDADFGLSRTTAYGPEYLR